LEYKLWHAISGFATDKYPLLQIKSALWRKPVQGRFIADQPNMSEGIDESTLPVGSPWSLVIPNLIKTAICTRLHGACNDSIWVIAEQFDPDRSNAYRFGAFPAIPGWLGKEERCTLNLQSHDGSQTP
jgi:hypothetical protein